MINQPDTAPAPDGMVINPDRYWHEQFQKAQKETAKLEAENTELKKRLFDSISETERTKEDRNRLNFKFERELKRQLADKDAETEAASGRRHENS